LSQEMYLLEIEGTRQGGRLTKTCQRGYEECWPVL